MIRRFTYPSKKIPHDLYTLELLAHPNLKQHNDKIECISVYNLTSMILLKKNNNTYNYYNAVVGDHYMTAKHTTNSGNEKETISVFSRGYGDKLDTIGIPKDTEIYEIKGKWASLARSLQRKQYRDNNAYGMYN